MVSEDTYTINRVQNGDVVAVEIVTEVGSEIVRAQGVAKRDPADKFDSDTGYLLAYGRAYAALSAKLLKRAQGRIDHADSVRRHRESIGKYRATDTPYQAMTGTWGNGTTVNIVNHSNAGKFTY